MEDLVTVCEACHSVIHKVHQASGHLSLELATRKTLKQMKPPARTKKKIVLSDDPAPRLRRVPKVTRSARAAMARRDRREGKEFIWVCTKEKGWHQERNPDYKLPST